MNWHTMLIASVAFATCTGAAAQNLTMADLLTSSKPVNTNAPPGALVIGGQPAATIVIPPEPSDEILFATKQFQTYVEKMSGAVLPVATGNDEVAGNRILLGVPDLAQEAGVTVPEDLDEEGYLIRSAGPDLVVLGGSDRGTLHGVCGLLEDHLGIRWYVAGDPLGECVPQMDDIVLGELNDGQSPSFPMRWIGRDWKVNTEWGLMNRQNGQGGSLEAGFKVEPVSRSASNIYHTQHALLPHSEYFDKHPEYFALIDGERSKLGYRCKLCYSNPDVAREVARRMAELLEADPDIDLVSFTPTDGGLWCECEACRAMDEEDVPIDQSKSRRSLLFYNAIAAELRKTHPEAKILVGAYNVYNWPPKDRSIKADPMLAVIITHYWYCHAHPVADPDCPPNVRYAELIEQWQNIGCDIYYFEYYMNSSWHNLPWPIVHCLKEDMPWYHQRGHKGVFSQFETGNAWTLFPAYYIAAKLLWDVEADVDAIFDEMCDRLFGKGGPAMREYYRVMEESMANCGAHLFGGVTRVGPKVFTDEVLAAMGDALDRAHELADGELSKQRLAKIDHSYEYTCRVMEYSRLQASTYAEKDAKKAVPIGEEALRVADDLTADLENNPDKWAGVVCMRRYFPKEIERLREHVEKLRAEAD